jgi:hypothetical protein
MELLTSVGFGTAAAFFFMIGLMLIAECVDGLGWLVGVIFTSISVAGFVAAMIVFAMKYYFYLSAVGLGG